MYLILLSFLALLFAVNVINRLQYVRPIRIAQEGQYALSAPGKEYYILESDHYTVGQPFDQTTVSGRVFPYAPRHCTFFNVTVHSEDGTQFIMPVRVREPKRIKMERGEPVEVYGRVFSLENEQLITQQATLSGESGPVSTMCLVDNGETVFLRYFFAFVFMLAAGLCILLIALLAKRK